MAKGIGDYGSDPPWDEALGELPPRRSPISVTSTASLPWLRARKSRQKIEEKSLTETAAQKLLLTQ